VPRHGLGSRLRERTPELLEPEVLVGYVPLGLGPHHGTCVGNARFPTVVVGDLGKAPAAGGCTLSSGRLVDCMQSTRAGGEAPALVDKGRR
jgi:hypothetical protein